MRLALLATHFSDYSLELAIELAAQHEVMFLADRDKLTAECDPAFLADAQLKMTVVHFTQRRRHMRLAAELMVAHRLFAFKPDAVIAHEHGHPHITRMHRRAAKTSRLLLVVHDPDPHTGGGDEVFAIRSGSQIATQRSQADHLFAHGAYCAARLKQLSPKAKYISSMPHGPILRPRSICAPPNKNLALMFGRMEAYKGLEVLLETYRQLHHEGSKAKLHIAGAGPELDRLHGEFAKLPSCTIERGYIERDRVIELMRQADFVVAPYLEATQSGVVAAAFANGRPVLATRVGGIPDFVQDGRNGALVNARDPAALASAISRWPELEAAPEGGLWRGALSSSENELHWRLAAQQLSAAAGPGAQSQRS